jgi:hypothetical protein
MTLAFVPLIPGALRKSETGSGSSARVKPTSAGNANAPFESASSKLNSEPAPEPHIHRDPIITLERQGDTITHIRVQCPCGQVTELKCNY